MTGDVSTYDAAHSAAVLVHRTDRALVRMHGRDPLRILQGVVTNDVAGAPPDHAVYAALLTAKGRMVSDMRIIRRENEFLLDVPRAALEPLLETFRKTVPPLFARFEELADWRMLGVYGPRAADALRAHVNLPDDDEHALAHGDGVITVRTRNAGVDGYDVVASKELELDLPVADPATMNVLRVEAGVPAWGAELTDSTIPLEAGLQHAISTSKGCYTGQEVIIRILHRGHVNWHLRGVLLGAHEAVTELMHPESGKQVGRITSAVYSPRFEQHIALAYVRREVEPPATLRLGTQDGPEVRVVALPFA